MKFLFVLFLLANAVIANADPLNIQQLNCTAYNVYGMSQFELQPETKTLITQTTSTLGLQSGTYSMTEFKQYQMFGSLDVPFSAIQFTNTNKTDETQYVLVLNTLLSKEQQYYTGVWGSVVEDQTWSEYIPLIPLAAVNCEIHAE